MDLKTVGGQNNHYLKPQRRARANGRARFDARDDGGVSGVSRGGLRVSAHGARSGEGTRRVSRVREEDCLRDAIRAKAELALESDGERARLSRSRGVRFSSRVEKLSLIHI